MKTQDLARVAALVCGVCSATAVAGSEIHKLLPDDHAQGDAFGPSAISGTTVVSGAPGNDDLGAGSGAAYVFDTTSGNQLRKLLPADGAADDRFGAAVAVSGGVALVGAPGDDDLGSESGAAYLFDVVTGAELGKLLPGDGAQGDRFGDAVAMQGTTAVIAAIGDSDNGPGSGSVYLFDTTTGAELAKLLPLDGAADDQFGHSVAISSTSVLVGAIWDDDRGHNSGSAYLFDVRTGGQVAKFLPDPNTDNDSFGWSVAIDGPTVLVGAPFSDRGGCCFLTGMAYQYDAATGALVRKLGVNDVTAYDLFGMSVAALGDTLLVGAAGHAHIQATEGAGAAYLFDATDGSLIEEHRPSQSFPIQRFGTWISLSCGRAVIGAEDPSGGSAYVFADSCSTFCDGADGALASCPCAGGTADTGCDTQDASGGVGLRLVRRTATPTNRVTWSGHGFPASGTWPSVVIRSAGLAQAPTVFGDGVRCIGPSVVRLGAAAATGGFARPVHGHGAQAGAGTYYYQLWFRETPGSYCDPVAVFNLSNGVRLTW
jgi:hypothetical protein